MELYGNSFGGKSRTFLNKTIFFQNYSGLLKPIKNQKLLIKISTPQDVKQTLKNANAKVKGIKLRFNCNRFEIETIK